MNLLNSSRFNEMTNGSCNLWLANVSMNSCLIPIADKMFCHISFFYFQTSVSSSGEQRVCAENFPMCERQTLGKLRDPILLVLPAGHVWKRLKRIWTFHDHIHTYGPFRDANQPERRVFRLWEEVRGNPHRQRENATLRLLHLAIRSITCDCYRIKTSWAPSEGFRIQLEAQYSVVV